MGTYFPLVIKLENQPQPAITTPNYLTLHKSRQNYQKSVKTSQNMSNHPKPTKTTHNHSITSHNYPKTENNNRQKYWITLHLRRNEVTKIHLVSSLLVKQNE